MKNDMAYANGDFIPNAADYPDKWADAARDFRESEAAIGRARLNTGYGASEREKFDLFHPAGRAEGLVVFVHGGYWHKFDRSYWSHFARGCTVAGYAVAMPSYPLAPDARICEITRAIASAIETAASFVQGPIHLTGHSAGGHLVARMLCRDVAIAEDVRARISHVIPISPLSDLRPLLETSMNATLGLDEPEAIAESPVEHDPLPCEVTTWVGAEERPAFLDQARWLSERWSHPMRIAPGRHHFDILDDLEHPDSPL
ncbi:MAG: alpha/beta hydrolase, partial [Boseongicola sp.]|nr:alpha/beta hydrolase [Boseongicola sp.]